MQQAYLQQQPVIHYDFSNAEFSGAVIESYANPNVALNTSPVSLYDVQKYHRSYYRTNTRLLDHSEDGHTKGLIDSAVKHREKAIKEKDKNVRNAWQSGLITATGYFLALLPKDTMPLQYAVMASSAALNFMMHNKTNLLFGVTRDYVDQADKQKQLAKERDCVVYALNGGDISQCVYKEDTLKWAEQFKASSNGGPVQGKSNTR